MQSKKDKAHEHVDELTQTTKKVADNVIDAVAEQVQDVGKKFREAGEKMKNAGESLIKEGK
jgi:hypothetical protein